MLYFNDQLLHGEQGSRIGLCTLWTPRKRYEDLLDVCKVIGNLYSPYGIGVMIRNVLAEPGITDIILTGVENPDPSMRRSDELLTGQILPAEVRLTPEQIGLFYRAVNIHDLRHIPLSQKQLILDFILRVRDTAPKRPEREPVIVPLDLGDTDGTTPTSHIGHFIQASNPERAWNQLLREIRMFGDRTNPDREGHYRQELRYTMVSLPAPGAVETERMPFADVTAQQMLAYGLALWEGNEPGDLTYRYGHTMRHRFGDQIAKVQHILREKSTSFRPYISLWDPANSLDLDDQPCLVSVQPILRDGRLDLAALFRTHDAFRAWPLNVLGLSVFHDKLSESLGAETGGMVIISGSAHIYSYDIPMADEALGKHRAWNKLQLDPKGDWRFSVDEGGDYVAELYSRGRLLRRTIVSSKEQLKRYVLPFLSDISHALYIGEAIASLP